MQSVDGGGVAAGTGRCRTVWFIFVLVDCIVFVVHFFVVALIASIS